MAGGAGEEATARRLAAGAVVALLLVGLVLRALQASAYLPWNHHWDEINNIVVGEEMSAGLDVDPGFYDYPALVFLAQAVVLVPARYVTDYDPPGDALLDVQTTGNARVTEPGLLRAMRWVTGVLPGLVVIGAAAALAWQATRRWWVAATAALLATISAVDLRFAMFVTPDGLTGMATTLAMLGAVTITLQPTQRRYILTGAAVGLAAAAKYNAGAAVIALLVAHALTHRQPLRERRLLVAGLLAAAVIFAVVNIGAMLHPVRFVQELGSEGVNYGTSDFDSELSLVFNLRWLWQSFGLGLVLALGSLLAETATLRRIVLVLWSFVGPYFLLVSAFPKHFARNLLPVTGSLAALAAIGLFVATRRLGAALRQPAVRHAVTAALGVALVAVPATGAVAATRDATEDPWSETQQWLEDNVDPGTTIAVEALTPYVDEARYEVVTTRSLGRRRLDWFHERGVTVAVAAEEMYEQFLDDPDAEPEATRRYERLLAPDCVIHEITGAGRRLVVTRIPPC